MGMIKWLCIGFLVLSITLSVSGTYIELATTVDLPNIVNETSTGAKITLTNMGDEPAYNVIVEPVFLQGFSSEQIALGNINPNQTVEDLLKLGISPDVVPGRYNMALLIRYSDLNDYPFTFVTPVRFFYKKAVQSNIVALFKEEVELMGDEQNTMVLAIQNRDDRQHQTTIRLYAPNQIAVEEKERTVTLPPSSESTVEFKVSSLGALPGGSYFVFASIDYEEGGMHYSSSGNGRITTKKEESYIGSLAPVIVVVVVVLVIGLIYLQLRPDKPVKPAAKRGKGK